MLSVFRALAIWTVSTLAAGGISYAVVCGLLGYRWSGAELDPFDDVRALRAEIRELVAFERGGHLPPGRLEGFAAALGITPAALSSANASNPHFIPLEDVIQLNPYPQTHRSEHYPCWLSVGYRSNDKRYHQITWYGGESDTTPSLLVRKVRPYETLWGDYFIRYSVKLSKETTEQPEIYTNKTGEVMRWRPPSPRPRVERLRWHTYRGGSYNGFEEGGFTLIGTLAVAPILARALPRVKRRLRRSPSSNPSLGQTGGTLGVVLGLWLSG